MHRVFDILIHGPDGRLEGAYCRGKSSKAVLLLHPDPEHGGHMRSKIMQFLNAIFIKDNFDTLRINFRGVGKSQGKFSKGKYELFDALAALDWLTQRTGPTLTQLWIVGYSFGALIALQSAMRRPETTNFVSITPSIESGDLNLLTPCPNGLFIHGSEDTTVNHVHTQSLSETLQRQNNIINYCCIDQADHYYTNKLADLQNIICDYIHQADLNNTSKDIAQNSRTLQLFHS